MASEDNAVAADSPVIVARAVKVKGLKGEIVAELLTDFPERFEHIDQFFAISPEGEQIAVVLEHFSFQGERVVLKLAGCDSIESAGAFVGFDFAVPDTDKVELAEDEYYDWELEGCRVETANGEFLGQVTGIMRTGGANLLAVASEGRESKLIPMVESILIGVDKQKKLIVVDPPEGLLDL
jgi:16S rRNA processing protein RimM